MIIKNVSGEFKAGTATAIVGPSGSGKTTLLNFICTRMKESPSLAVNGSLFINGHRVNSINEMKHRFGYVMQDDLLYQDFSPKEQLVNIAKLSGVKDVEGNVEKITEIFSLEKCQNTWVGGVFRKGISGGEKKRTSIGLEVVTDPSVIFMDEPTTGLDSKTALDVAKLIKALAANGRTIITTIHQPSTDILARFDRIICLCEGQMIYDGKPLDIPQYFSALGYAPPPHTNPADHLMAILNDDDIRIRELNLGHSITEAEVRKEFTERLTKFSEAYQKARVAPKHEKCPDPEFEELKSNPHQRGFCYTFCFLMGRFYIYFYRNFFTLFARLVQFVMFALFNIAIFTTLKDYEVNTIGAIQDKVGMILILTAVICFAGILSSIAGNLQPLPMFFREYEARLYNPVTYYLVSTLYDIPIQLILTLVYLGSAWFVIDIKSGTDAFFKWFSICLFSYTAGTGAGDIMAFYIQDLATCCQMYPIVCMAFFILSGFIARIKDMVFYLIGFSYFSFFRFGYQAGIYIEFGDGVREQYMAACKIRPEGCFEDSCAVASPGNPACDIFTTNDFPEKDFGSCLAILIAQSIVFRIIAASIFYWKSVDRKIPYEELPSPETFVDPRKEEQETYVKLKNEEEENFKA